MLNIETTFSLQKCKLSGHVFPLPQSGHSLTLTHTHTPVLRSPRTPAPWQRTEKWTDISDFAVSEICFRGQGTDPFSVVPRTSIKTLSCHSGHSGVEQRRGWTQGRNVGRVWCWHRYHSGVASAMRATQADREQWTARYPAMKK